MSILYSDSLVEITDESITFRKFAWKFSYRPRRLNFSDIARIEARPPSFWSGKWRLFGTGDFRTWFPLDWKRPSRDKIFVAFLRDSRLRILFPFHFEAIGFTVEDSKRVEMILKQNGLLNGNTSA